jgi:NADP-dependent 3-hydroxy acid dehydrogenase YdfG
MLTTSRTVVITGASSGIGAALARHLGGAGHRVVLAARRQDALEAVAATAGTDALAVVTDVRRRAEVERLRDEAIRAFGHVDVWVNNAGRGIGRPALDLTDEEFDEMMLVNVKSALYGMQAIVPHFIARGRGQVINVSSVLGRAPVATIRSAYSAAKAALNSLTANVRADVRAAHPGIHVTLVLPGLVMTEFGGNVLGSGGGAPPASGPGAPPPGVRPQTPEEVAAVIARVIDTPVAEAFTNPASAGFVREYYEDIEAFEAASREGPRSPPSNRS